MCWKIIKANIQQPKQKLDSPRTMGERETERVV